MTAGGRSAGLVAAAAIVLLGAAPAGAEIVCGPPSPLTAIAVPLERTGARVAAGQTVTIIAFGSSSTVGVGASTPADSYPRKLQAALQARFPRIDIRVVNRGVSGQDAPEEVARLDRDIVPGHPDLVIWQVGTNAVLRRDDLSTDERLIRRGIELIRKAGSDLILMDLQYAPRVLQRPAYDKMERLLDDVAQQAKVGLFHRFALMRAWAQSRGLAATPMVGRDGLHMTDAGYECLATRLADALASNWKAQRRIAVAPAAIAGLAHGPAATPR